MNQLLHCLSICLMALTLAAAIPSGSAQASALTQISQQTTIELYRRLFPDDESKDSPNTSTSGTR